MRLEFTPSFREQYSATLAAMRHSTLQLVAGLAFPVVGLVLLLFIVLLARRPPTLTELLLIAVCLVFTPAITAFNVWLYRRKNRTVVGTHVITIEDGGVRITAPMFETLLRWEALRRVVETRHFILLFISVQRAQYIPKRVMATEQLRTLREIVGQKVKV